MENTLLTALIEVKAQKLLKLEIRMNGPVCVAPLIPSVKLCALSRVLVTRHGVLMSFPYGPCSTAFTVAARVAYGFTSPFAFLPVVEWMHTCTNTRSHGLNGWGSKAVKPEEISPPPHFLGGDYLRKKRGEKKKSSIAN